MSAAATLGGCANKRSADLKSGDYGLLCTFGAGYSAGSVILRKL